jgi:hypothetical protein
VTTLNVILVAFYRTRPKSPLINGADAAAKSGDTLMRMILGAVAFAALMAPPLFARSPKHEGPVSGIYVNQLDVDNRDLSAPRYNQDATDNSLCSTAHDFCPGFHGDND